MLTYPPEHLLTTQPFAAHLAYAQPMPRRLQTSRPSRSYPGYHYWNLSPDVFAVLFIARRTVRIPPALFIILGYLRFSSLSIDFGSLCLFGLLECFMDAEHEGRPAIRLLVVTYADCSSCRPCGFGLLRTGFP